MVQINITRIGVVRIMENQWVTYEQSRRIGGGGGENFPGPQGLGVS